MNTDPDPIVRRCRDGSPDVVRKMTPLLRFAIRQKMAERGWLRLPRKAKRAMARQWCRSFHNTEPSGGKESHE